MMKTDTSPRARRHGLGLLFLVAALCLPSTAQELPAQADTVAEEPAAPPPRELELERIQLQRRLLAASLNPLKAGISQLDELARARAAGRDYPGAIAARDERRRLESELERIVKEMLVLETRELSLKTALLPERILLPLDQARLDGVAWDPERKCLTRWQRPGAQAEWTLPGLPPGGYEVLVTYQCNPLEGGTVLVSEKTFTLTGEMDTTLRGPETKTLGTLKITDGAGPLRLTARTVVKDNLMDLLAVELVPANR